MIRFLITDLTKDITYKRLLELGYKFASPVNISSLSIKCFVIEGVHSSILMHSTIVNPSETGSLDDLFNTDQYKCKAGSTTVIGNYTVVIKETIKFGCQELKTEQLKAILAAYAEYNGLEALRKLLP